MMIFLMKIDQRLKTMYLMTVSENDDDTIRELPEVADSLSSSECDAVNTILTKDGTM